MEPIKVKSFYIYEDGGYRMDARWYMKNIKFETHPSDAPELLINGWPQVSYHVERLAPWDACVPWVWEDLITAFPNPEWNEGNENDQAHRRFSTIQKLADEIYLAIERASKNPTPY